MRATLRARGVAVALVTSLTMGGAVARAGDANESGAAAAESLFQEARKAMDARRYAEACPKLAASHKLSPALGTLLNLADCYEKNGQLASAWVRFHEAIALAQRLGRPEREKTARERAEKLEPRLVKLTIVSAEPGVDVKLDGNALEAAILGAAIPVDPGKHTVEATAKGKKSFVTSIEVTERTRAANVEIPRLDAAPAGAPDPESRPGAKPVMAAKPVMLVRPEDGAPGDGATGATQRWMGIAGMGLGAVGLGVGTFFGIRTSAKWSDAKTHCAGLDCDAQGVDLASQAKTSGNISTVAFIAGGVLAAGGAALFFTAPRATSAASGPSVLVGVGPGDVRVRGTF